MHVRVLAGIALLLASASSIAQENPPPSTPANTLPAQIADPSAPLPDIQTLFTRVRARYGALEALRKTYICTMTQVADEFSSNGTKKTHTDQYDVFYVGNNEVLQHISRDGKPLSPTDAKKEQDRVDKEVARLKSHDNTPERDQLRLSAVFKVATFTNPRRELLKSRPTLVFDYKGDPHAETHNIGEQIMRELSGTLWIDERDNSIVRLNGTLQQNFHVAGGLLVNIKKGSWFDFTEAPVNGEIWFPARLDAHVDGRFLLVKGFDGNAHQTFSDYRKLKTSVTILPGTQVLDEADPPASQQPADIPPKL